MSNSVDGLVWRQSAETRRDSGREREKWDCNGFAFHVFDAVPSFGFHRENHATFLWLFPPFPMLFLLLATDPGHPRIKVNHIIVKMIIALSTDHEMTATLKSITRVTGGQMKSIYKSWSPPTPTHTHTRTHTPSNLCLSVSNRGQWALTNRPDVLGIYPSQRQKYRRLTNPFWTEQLCVSVIELRG